MVGLFLLLDVTHISPLKACFYKKIYGRNSNLVVARAAIDNEHAAPCNRTVKIMRCIDAPFIYNAL